MTQNINKMVSWKASLDVRFDNQKWKSTCVNLFFIFLSFYSHKTNQHISQQKNYRHAPLKTHDATPSSTPLSS